MLSRVTARLSTNTCARSANRRALHSKHPGFDVGGQSKRGVGSTILLGTVTAAAAIGVIGWAGGFGSRKNYVDTAPRPTAFDPNAFKPFELTDVSTLTHDTKKYRFSLPPGHVMGLDVASCIVVKAPIGEGGKVVIRPYTPISPANAEGYFELAVKTYKKGVMSAHVHSLAVGDTIEVKGPIPKIPYTPNMKKRIGMVAGGSGITPMYQVIEHVLANSSDKTEITLLFANHTADDIILRSRLDHLSREHPNFRVHYVVSRNEDPDWPYTTGRINRDILKAHMPPPSDDAMVFICGPPSFMKDLSGEKAPDKTQGPLTGALAALGYSSSQVFKF